MGRKRQQQVTGLTFEERAERAERSQSFFRIKRLKRWANRRTGLANTSRSGKERESWRF